MKENEKMELLGDTSNEALLRNDIYGLRQELYRLRQAHEAQRTEFTSLAKRVDKTNARVDALCGDIGGVASKYATLNQYCLDIDQSVAKLRDEIENKEVSTHDELVERLDEERKRMQDEINSHELRLDSHEKTLADIEERHQNDILETIQKVLNKVQSNNKPWIDRIEEVARLNQNNHRHHTQLINDVAHSVGVLRTETEQYRNKVLDQGTENKTLIRQLDNLYDVVRTLNNEVFRNPENPCHLEKTVDEQAAKMWGERKKTKRLPDKKQVEKLLNELLDYMGMHPLDELIFIRRKGLVDIVYEHVIHWMKKDE